MKKTYIKPEACVVQVAIETIMAAVSGLGISDTAARQDAGMDARNRGSRTSDDFDELW